MKAVLVAVAMMVGVSQAAEFGVSGFVSDAGFETRVGMSGISWGFPGEGADNDVLEQVVASVTETRSVYREEAVMADELGHGIGTMLAASTEGESDIGWFQKTTETGEVKPAWGKISLASIGSVVAGYLAYDQLKGSGGGEDEPKAPAEPVDVTVLGDYNQVDLLATGSRTIYISGDYNDIDENEPRPVETSNVK